MSALQTGSGYVAMGGRRHNDAARVGTEADVRNSYRHGPDVAMEAADVTLVSGDPNGIATAIHFLDAPCGPSGRILFWAFIYNATLDPNRGGRAVCCYSVTAFRQASVRAWRARLPQPQ